MDYKNAIKLAGGKILAYKTFGSCQGRWIAIINIKGTTKYITDYFGSHSDCDTLKFNFKDSWHDNCINEHYYNPIHDGFNENCKTCQRIKKKFILFGQEYIDNAISFEECLKIISKDLAWDLEVQTMINWLKQQLNKKD